MKTKIKNICSACGKRCAVWHFTFEDVEDEEPAYYEAEGRSSCCNAEYRQMTIETDENREGRKEH